MTLGTEPGTGAGRPRVRKPPHRDPQWWLKEGAFGLCTVLARLGSSDRAAPPCVILSYHSHSSGAWGVGIREFEGQVRFLSSRFRLVRLADLPLHAADPREPVACLTFDDGYLDNYEVTLPILERHGAKGTFFLISSMLGRPLRTSAGQVQRLLTPAQAREMASLGHEIGSHTMTHRVLTGLPLDVARSEIADSKRALEDLLGVAVRSFSYPLGKRNADLHEATRRAGYELAVTTTEALVPPAPDWLALPRVSVNRSVGPLQFRAKVSRGLGVYNRLRGRDERTHALLPSVP